MRLHGAPSEVLQARVVLSMCAVAARVAMRLHTQCGAPSEVLQTRVVLSMCAVVARVAMRLHAQCGAPSEA
jgi:hypothetical protein